MKTIVYFIVIVSSLFVIQSLLDSEPSITNDPPSGESIVSFGDSLTFGTGASEGMDYPSQLSLLLNEEVINKGRPGDTTHTALKRINNILKLNPRIVLLTLGGNDLKNGVSKEAAFKNLKIIINKIQDTGALVIIGGVDIPFFGRGFADAYEELAIETGSVLVPNVFEDIMGNAKLMNDRIHPNDEGYAIMAQYFYQAIEPYL